MRCQSYWDAKKGGEKPKDEKEGRNSMPTTTSGLIGYNCDSKVAGHINRLEQGFTSARKNVSTLDMIY